MTRLASSGWDRSAYVGTQFALLLGYWFVGWAAAMRGVSPVARHATLDNATSGGCPPPCSWCSCSSASAPTEEPNWPVTAYLSGLVLAVAWLARNSVRQVGAEDAWPEAGLATACLAGVAVSLSSITPIGCSRCSSPFPGRRLRIVPCRCGGSIRRAACAGGATWRPRWISLRAGCRRRRSSRCWPAMPG